MAIVRLPAYTVERGGSYFWQLPSWSHPDKAKDAREKVRGRALRNGKTCPVQSTALGKDLGAAISKADNLNDAFKEWREGAESVVARGSVQWLFRWYRQQARFRDLSYKTRKDYGRLMNVVADFPTRDGLPLGKKSAAKIDATVADSLYEKLQARGGREATYAMQVCRLVWAWAVRHKGTTGVTWNPFAGMGLKSTAEKGNRATSRAEYDLYRATARAMGFQSMATAAALAFECCQRTWDVFGFEDPDGVKARGFEWDGYRLGGEIRLDQSKTGNPVVLPLTMDMEGEDGPWTLLLYPELCAELARSKAAAPDGAALIVLEERSGKQYKERRMSTVHRAICDKAGLPKEMTFTGFRHGGITEVGSVDADVRPISGHATLDVTRIYNKATAEKARQIAAQRRALIEA